MPDNQGSDFIQRFHRSIEQWAAFESKPRRRPGIRFDKIGQELAKILLPPSGSRTYFYGKEICMSQKS